MFPIWVRRVLPLLVLVVVGCPVLAVWTLAAPAPPAGHVVAVLQEGRGYLGVLPRGGGRLCGGCWRLGGSGAPQLGVVLVVGGGGGVEVGLVVVPGLVVVVLVLRVEVARLLGPLGRRSDGQLVRTGGLGAAAAGVTGVRSHRLSHLHGALVSLGHGGQLGRLVVSSGALHVAPGHVGHVRDL